MKCKKDLVSIIMPCYNVEKFIEESIYSILNQTYKNIELIIVNDSTPDKSIELAKEIQKTDNRIRIVNNKYIAHNIADVMNTGLDYSEGEYITRLDSDDIIHESKIEEQVNFLNKNKNIIMCSTNLKFININNEKIKTRDGLKLEKDFDYKFLYLFGNPLPAAPSMFKAKIIKENNLRFDPYFERSAEDFDFISRYLVYGNFGLIDKQLYFYRILKTSLSNSTAEEIVNRNSIKVCLENVKRYLDLKENENHRYLTYYYQKENHKIDELSKKAKELSDIEYRDIIELSIWANTIIEKFEEKYEIKDINKYKDYLNSKIISYVNSLKKDYIFINCSLVSRTVYYYKLYGFKATIKKIFSKIIGA